MRYLEWIWCKHCGWFKNHERKGSEANGTEGIRVAPASPTVARCPTPANMRLRSVAGRVPRWYCSWCAYSSISPTVVEQHEVKEH